MRLLNTSTGELKSFNNPPAKYAILSHVWREDEQSFQDVSALAPLLPIDDASGDLEHHNPLPSTPPGTCGILVPGVEVRIVREDGTDAALHEPGELWVRGTNVVPGYYKNEKATKETFVDGWLHTGDKMYTDGTFFL